MSVLRRSPRPAEGFDAGALSLRQRLSLMIGTGLAAETLVKMDDADIHHDFLLRNGVRAPLLKAGKVSVAQLQARGVASTEHLRALEYNTLDLLDGAFCAECVAAFGHFRARSAAVMSVTSGAESPMADLSDASIVYTIPAGLEPVGGAPTSSVVAQEAIVNAVMFELIARTGFTASDFKFHHPGGALGAK